MFAGWDPRTSEDVSQNSGSDDRDVRCNLTRVEADTGIERI